MSSGNAFYFTYLILFDDNRLKVTFCASRKCVSISHSQDESNLIVTGPWSVQYVVQESPSTTVSSTACKVQTMRCNCSTFSWRLSCQSQAPSCLAFGFIEVLIKCLEKYSAFSFTLLRTSSDKAGFKGEISLAKYLDTSSTRKRGWWPAQNPQLEGSCDRLLNTAATWSCTWTWNLRNSTVDQLSSFRVLLCLNTRKKNLLRRHRDGNLWLTQELIHLGSFMRCSNFGSTAYRNFQWMRMVPPCGFYDPCLGASKQKVSSSFM